MERKLLWKKAVVERLKFNMNMHHQLEKKDEDSAEDVEDLEERYDRI